MHFSGQYDQMVHDGPGTSYQVEVRCTLDTVNTENALSLSTLAYRQQNKCAIILPWSTIIMSLPHRSPLTLISSLSTRYLPPATCRSIRGIQFPVHAPTREPLTSLFIYRANNYREARQANYLPGVAGWLT